MENKKLWGGRFTSAANPSLDSFHSSISFDYKLYKYDISGSIAHAKMLGKQGIITSDDAALIVKTLEEIRNDIGNGNVAFDVSAEDIHMNVEKILIDRIGDPGRKLHTARSRNDQVALDSRMYIMDKCREAIHAASELGLTIIRIAKDNTGTIMPGYTHLQKAQPVTLAFHMMAYFEMFKRDIIRFQQCYEETDEMPLGSGALSASSHPIDRNFVKDELGFSRITQNAMDGVGNRDFAIDFTHACSMLMMHLSRLSEEIVLWSTDEFGFLSLADEYCTGSSIMPQKKNPDIAELVRGKTARTYGNELTLLTMMKGLPLAYNKDMQEDKEAFFDSAETVLACVDIINRLLSTAAFHGSKMLAATESGFLNATDLADYMVKKNVPFRKAHEVVGAAVLKCIKENKRLSDLTLDELNELYDCFGIDIYDAISIDHCVSARSIPGGTAPDAVMEHIRKSEVWLGKLQV